MTDKRLLTAAAGLATLALAAVVVLGDAGQPWRPLFAMVFLAVGPGLCLVPLLGLGDRQAELLLVVPVSLMVGILSSAALFYSRTWSPDRALGVLGAVCVAGVLLQYGGHVLSARRPA